MRCTWASFSSIGIMSFCGTCKWTFPGYFNSGHINFSRALTSFNWIGFCVVNFLMPFNLSGYTTVRFICGDRMTGLQCHRIMGISIKLFKCQIYRWTCYRASDEVTVFICCVIIGMVIIEWIPKLLSHLTLNLTGNIRHISFPIFERTKKIIKFSFFQFFDMKLDQEYLIWL